MAGTVVSVNVTDPDDIHVKDGFHLDADTGYELGIYGAGTIWLNAASLDKTVYDLMRLLYSRQPALAEALIDRLVEYVSTSLGGDTDGPIF